jgi:hypothetical protein
MERIPFHSGGRIMKYFVPLLVLACTVAATPPMFDDYVLVYANGNPIQVSGGHADPCMKDWDGDGVQDLLVGQYSGGNIRFYRNVGTNSAPEFTTFEYLYADGSIISMPYG